MMATHQDCWTNTGKTKDGDLNAREWLSKLEIGDKLLHPPPQLDYNLTSPRGDEFETVLVKEKHDNHIIISYPNRNQAWDKKLPLKYAFAVRPIDSINNNNSENEDDDLSGLSQSSTNSNASVLSPSQTIPFPPNNNIKNETSHISMTFNKSNKKSQNKKQLHVFRDNQKELKLKSPTPTPSPTPNPKSPESTPEAANNTLFNKLHSIRDATTHNQKLKYTYANTKSKNARNRQLLRNSNKKKGHLLLEEQSDAYQTEKRPQLLSSISEREKEEKKRKKHAQTQKQNQKSNHNHSHARKSMHGGSEREMNGRYNRYNNYNNSNDSDDNKGPMTRSRFNNTYISQSYESYKNGTIPSWMNNNNGNNNNIQLLEPIGLINMGNTCFMNSTLQSLIHTSELRQFFLQNNQNKWISQQLNLDNPIGYKGKIAMNFCKLIYKMCDESNNTNNNNSNSYYYNNNSIRPSMIHYNLSGVLRQFADYRQHDAQEFMTNFLDALHEDLNRIKKKKYMEIPDFDKYEINEDKKREFLNKRWHEIYLKRNNSICTDLFAGLLKSAVTCPKCDFTAITFDPFMHLLVPLKCKSNLFNNNNSQYCSNNKYNNKYNNNSNQKYEIEFILLPKDERDESEIYNIKINQNIVKNNDWISLNGYIYDYLIKMDTSYKSNLKDEKYRSDMIKSGEFNSSYLFYGRKHIQQMQEINNNTFHIPKCMAKNDKIVNMPLFSIFELCEEDKILYLNSIETNNYNTQINDYIFGKGHRRLILQELPSHWTDINKLQMEMTEKINCHIIFKKPSNNNNNNSNSNNKEEKEEIDSNSSSNLYEPFNYPRFIFEKGLSGKLSCKDLNEYLYKKGEYIAMGISGDKINKYISQMEIKYTTNDNSIFKLNKINSYKTVNISNNNSNNYKPESVKTMVIIFSFEMQQIYIQYQRNKEIELNNNSNSNNSKKRSFEEANMNGNDDNNPHKKQKLSNNNNNKNELPLKFRVLNQTASTIEECFGMYLHSEQLGKDNKWYCKKCKLHVQGRKKLDLWWLPKYLIIVIKRFENHGLRKCTSHVKYPINGLDLTQLIGGKNSLDIYYNDHEKNNGKKYNNKKFIYDLYAVINHSGSLNFGHYTATIKFNKKWYDISDSCVSNCSDPISSQAYILCYKQQ